MVVIVTWEKNMYRVICECLIELSDSLIINEKSHEN